MVKQAYMLVRDKMKAFVEIIEKPFMLVLFSTVMSFFFFYYFVPKINIRFLDNNDLLGLVSVNNTIMSGIFTLIIFSIFAGIFICFSRDILFRIKSTTKQSFFLVFQNLRIGFSIGALFFIIFSLSLYKLDFLSYDSDFLINLIGGVILVFFIIFPEIICTRKSNEVSPKRFAYGAVGKDKDKYNYRDVAESEAIRLIQDVAQKKDRYPNVDSVVVKLLSGEQGWGKSSFQRMIIESIPSENLLYSHISLTEVNDEQDFGKLFSERWKETLAEKYPILTDYTTLSALKDIVRPQVGVLSNILDFFPSLIDPVIFWFKKIKLKIFPLAAQEMIFADREISRVFFNLSEINENAWVIVIDEIERSPLPEVYRVIEVIERFKTLGRNGLPVQIIFLCILDEKVLKDRTNSKEVGNDYYDLITGFFFSSGIKTVSGKIFLPPVPRSVRSKIIRDFIDALLTKYPLMSWKQEQNVILNELTGIMPYLSLDVDSSHSKKDQLEFVLRLLTNESPRLIEKVFNNIENVLELFVKASYPFHNPFYTLADLFLMEYGKLKFSEFNEYLSKITARITEPRWPWRMDDLIPFSLDPKERKLSLKQGISKVLNIEVDKISDDLVSFIYMLSPSHNRVFRQENFEKEIRYVNTLAWPGNMLRYLRLAWRGDSDAYTRSALYLEGKQKDNNMDISSMSSNEFRDFVSFTSGVEEYIDTSIYVDICNDAVRRINSGEFPINLLKYEGSAREDVIVSILRIVIKISEKINTRKKEGVLISLADIFENLIQAKLSVGEIYRIINWTLRVDRNDFSGSFIQAISQWYNGGENGFKKLIKTVIMRALNRYNKRLVIYNYEPLSLVQFAIYQSWSKVDNKNEIRKLRKIASRKLYEYKEVIEFLWQPLASAFNPSWKNFADVSESGVWGTVSVSPVYLPLKALIFAAKKNPDVSQKIKDQLSFWSQIAESDEYRNYIKSTIDNLIRNNEHTIHSYLLENGYLDNNPLLPVNN